jgi:16S rRNA (cytosine1402-N4)-methyltransferase
LFVPENFRHVQRFLRLHKIQEVDGLLADLGVSSHQLDCGERGFSTRYDAALDMRMDRRASLTAWQIVETYSEQALHKLFEQFGEVTNAKTLARTIVQVRQSQSLRTIEGFKQSVHEAVKGNPNKYFAQVFQALRMVVNDEMGSLRELLTQLPAFIKPGGRVVIITFHSGEDRVVKQFFKSGSLEELPDNPFISVPVQQHWKWVFKKPLMASQEEQQQNPRSRSAKLRVAEKC